MNEKIKFVIADIDGTLSMNPEYPTPFAIDVMEKLHEKGILFGIASGRPVVQIALMAKAWGMKHEPDCIVGLNGSELYDAATGETSQFNLLSRETLKRSLDIMKPFYDRANAMIYLGDKMVFQKDNFQYEATKKKYAGMQEVIVAEKEEDLYAHPNGKIMFRLEDPAEMPEVEKYVAQFPSAEYAAFKTDPKNFEFSDPNTDKANAMLAYAEKHGFGPENIAAFGDTTNDNGMIRAAGTGVCLVNGTQDTKDIADYITEYTCKDDGWAKWVLRYILEEE